MLATVIDLSRLGDPGGDGGGRRGHQGAYPHVARRRPGSTRCCCPANPSAAPRASGRQTGIPVDATTWHEIREAAAKLGITEAEIDRAVGVN